MRFVLCRFGQQDLKKKKNLQKRWETPSILLQEGFSFVKKEKKLFFSFQTNARRSEKKRRFGAHTGFFHADCPIVVLLHSQQSIGRDLQEEQLGQREASQSTSSAATGHQEHQSSASRMPTTQQNLSTVASERRQNRRT